MTWENRPRFSVPDYGEVIEIASFIESCKNNFFIDYDGNGYLAYDKKEHSGIRISPSDIVDKTVDDFPEYKYVIWFNK